MPPSDKRDRAERLWDGGEAVEAGRLIFEDLPQAERPPWAVRILQLVYDHARIHCWPIQDVIDIGNDPEDWRDAAFSAVRRVVLELEETQLLSHPQKLFLGELLLAECVAKVIYNATDPIGPFDEHSGWWVVACARHYVDLAQDNDLLAAAWAAISSRSGR